MFIKLLIYKINKQKIPGVPLALKEENAKFSFQLTHVTFVDSSIGFIQPQCVMCWCSMCRYHGFFIHRSENLY